MANFDAFLSSGRPMQSLKSLITQKEFFHTVEDARCIFLFKVLKIFKSVMRTKIEHSRAVLKYEVRKHLKKITNVMAYTFKRILSEF